MRLEKKTFGVIFAILAITLATLPFIVSLNEVLTRIIEKIKVYSLIQQTLVPIEVKMVGVLVNLLGINYGASGSVVSANGHLAEVTWNCLGWQSLLFFLITLFVGLKNKHYTLTSKVETIMIGLLGTFLINLLRITFVVILLAFNQQLFSVVYHDYLAAIITIVWLFGFWWFSYSFVLEEKK